MKKMNVAQAVFLAEKCDKLFERAAKAWNRGNDSGSNVEMQRARAQQDKFHTQAEALLAPLKIKCSYPGLYPVFHVKGYQEHSCLNAISAALDDSRKAAIA